MTKLSLEDRVKELVQRPEIQSIPREIKDLPIPEKLKIGDVCRLVGNRESGLFVFIETKPRSRYLLSEQHVFAPTFPEVSLASPWDVRIPVSDSPFHAAFIVEVWQKISVTKDYISAYQGRLSDKATNAVGELCIEWMFKGKGIKSRFKPWLDLLWAKQITGTNFKAKSLIECQDLVSEEPEKIL